jgi:hypothetical protein
MATTKRFDDNIRLDDLADKVSKTAGGIGAVFLLISIALGYMRHDDLKQFSHSYLVAYVFVLSITLGMLFWVTLQHLTNAKWSIVVRRVGELFATNMALMAILALPFLVPLILGNASLFVWADPARVHSDPELQHKYVYLNVGTFMLRFVVFFGFWALLARYFFKRSLEQDKTGDADLIRRMGRTSGWGMWFFALTLTFGSFDLVMSVEPHWFSTIFGVYFFAGCVVSVHATLILVLMWLQNKGRLVKSITVEHYHDLGKMMFAFVIFWTYIGFSQFLLYWYGNIPEETAWYHERFAGQWAWLSCALLFGNFCIPFLGLMSRHVKRNRKALAFWCVWLLAMHWIDVYWMIMPSEGTLKLPLSVIDLTALVGISGICIAGAAYRARSCNLLPTRDPRLSKSLAFENM